MPFVDDIVGFFKRNQGYFLGKAVLMAVVGGASLLFGGSILIPGLAIVGGGLALHAYGRFNELRYYKQQMVDLYRDDIAEHLGIAPQEVSIAHLKEAAKDNEVIAQALERQHKKTLIEVGTSLLAGAVTAGLLVWFGNAGAFHAFTEQTFTGILAPAVNFIGLSTLGSISGFIFHDVLGFAIGAKTGVVKAAAHDLILGLENQVSHGRPISREQVYGVLVAGNPALQQAVASRFGKSYAWMNAAQQSAVLHEVGIAGDMDAIAQQINRGEIRPGRLAYMMDDDAPRAMRSNRSQSQAMAAETPEAARSADNSPGFVERLGLAPRESATRFADRLDAERSARSERAV